MFHDFSYKAVLAASTRATWQIDDVLPVEAQLDFSRPFLPEALAAATAMRGLDAAERLTLNHIRAHEYLSIFALVEEFILPFLLDHIRSDLAMANDERVRALLQFASEEAKHIELFHRFHDRFVAGFGTDCAVIGPSEAIAAEVLRHHPLSVALLILHIEWMTQDHYLDSVHDDSGLDPLFAGLLRYHWMEEAQHARLDTLIVEALAARRTEGEIDAAVEGYLQLGSFIDDGLRSQATLNLAALERAIGRSLDSAARDAFLEGQHRSLRRTYLGSGMTHQRFRATLSAISPDAAARVACAAVLFQ